MRSVFFLLIILTLLVGCSRQTSPAPTVEIIRVPPGVALESRLLAPAGPARPADRDPAADFSYTMADGTTHRLSELRGKLVIINFWASWCLPCRTELPAFQQAVEAYGGEVVLLAVNRNETAEVVARFAQETGFDFALITNYAGDIGDAYGVTSLPLTYFLNRDGTINARHIGALNLEAITEQIEALQ